MLELNKIHLGDCLDLMGDIPDKSVDMILCDLPYKVTEFLWDSEIDLSLLWGHYKRVLKLTGSVVLTSLGRFTFELYASNPKWYKYMWIWIKTRGSGSFPHAKNRPLGKHEEILVFSGGAIAHKSLSKRRMVYNPQGLKFNPKKSFRPNRSKRHNASKGPRPSDVDGHIQEYENYPNTILEFANPNTNSLHKTQKPVALFSYLIKTYSNEGNVILDNCIGSGTTAISALETGRQFIGIEKDKEYHRVAVERVEKYKSEYKQGQLL